MTPSPAGKKLYGYPKRPKSDIVCYVKLLRTTLLALAVLALVVPSIGFGGEMPVPLEKKVLAGTTTINYAGQTLRFTSSVTLLVKCEPESPTRFKMTVVLYPGTPPPPGVQTFVAETIHIYWSNVGTDVYSGGVPVAEPWTGWLNTEGGFVDR